MIRLNRACAYLLITLTALSSIVVAQNQMVRVANKERLNNDKIVEMVKAGISDAVIIGKIRQSGCDCDTSTAGLTQLKDAHIGDNIVLEMISAQGGCGASRAIDGLAASDNKPANAESLCEPGIYLNQDGALTELNPTVFSGSSSNVLGPVLTYGIKKVVVKGIVRGASAPAIVKSPRPEFYFSFDTTYVVPGAVLPTFLSFGADSPGEFLLVKMKRKSKTREAILGEAGILGGNAGPRDKDIQAFSVEKVKSGLFKVVPKADLAPGEYCFFYGGHKPDLELTGRKVFDFSVAQP